jgi:hypothetical protein
VIVSLVISHDFLLIRAGFSQRFATASDRPGIALEKAVFWVWEPPLSGVSGSRQRIFA